MLPQSAHNGPSDAYFGTFQKLGRRGVSPARVQAGNQYLPLVAYNSGKMGTPVNRPWSDRRPGIGHC